MFGLRDGWGWLGVGQIEGEWKRCSCALLVVLVISASLLRFAICVVLVALALFSSFLSSITNAVTALRSVRLDMASQEARFQGPFI